MDKVFPYLALRFVALKLSRVPSILAEIVVCFFRCSSSGTKCFKSDKFISNKSEIKITGGTFGKVVDVNLKDPLDLGRTMAPAAAMVFLAHLKDFRIDPSYYDLILTGDLSKFGSDIFIKCLESKNIFLDNLLN